MHAHQRQQALRALLESEGTVMVSDLAKRWSVSEMTVRRDLDRLTEEGVAARIHGGAVASGVLRFGQRRDRDGAEKQKAIAKLVDRVPEAGCIYLDGSTTVYRLVAHLDKRVGLSVATNNIDTFQRIAACSGVEPILIGGRLNRDTDNFVGPLARRCVAGLHFDAAFFSAYGITPEGGPCEPSLEDAEVKQCVTDRAAAHCLALHSRKFGRSAPGSWAPPAATTTLASDLAPDDERLASYRECFPTIV